MKINVADQKIPDLERVLFSIPETVRSRYRVIRSLGEGYFTVLYKKFVVAFVRVLEDKSLDIEFLENSTALKFKEIMELANQNNHPKSDLLWLALFPANQSSWTFIGRPEKTKEAALKFVSENMLDRMAILVSFWPDSKKGDWLAVESANYLRGDWPKIEIVEEDMGAKRFLIADRY